MKLCGEFSIGNAFKSLNIYPDKFYINKVTDLDNPVNIALKNFENHPSIKAITENITIHERFEFCKEEVSNITKEILNLK